MSSAHQASKADHDASDAQKPQQNALRPVTTALRSAIKPFNAFEFFESGPRGARFFVSPSAHCRLSPGRVTEFV